MTGNGTEISQKYKGGYFVAITKTKNKYGISAGFGRYGLIENLGFARKIIGKSFRVVRIYRGINCTGIVRAVKAARDLQVGIEVDLENILIN